jgi:hypothetical protein
MSKQNNSTLNTTRRKRAWLSVLVRRMMRKWYINNPVNTASSLGTALITFDTRALRFVIKQWVRVPKIRSAVPKFAGHVNRASGTIWFTVLRMQHLASECYFMVYR